MHQQRIHPAMIDKSVIEQQELSGKPAGYLVPEDVAVQQPDAAVVSLHLSLMLQQTAAVRAKEYNMICSTPWQPEQASHARAGTKVLQPAYQESEHHPTTWRNSGSVTISRIDLHRSQALISSQPHLHLLRLIQTLLPHYRCQTHGVECSVVGV